MKAPAQRAPGRAEAGAQPRGGSTAAAGRGAQGGGFVLGMVVGLLVGLALALAVALYITKAPVPFINKVPQRTAEQDSAETERNRNWDPNAPLAGKAGQRAAAAASAAQAAASAPPLSSPSLPSPPVAAALPQPPLRDPASILSGGVSAPPGAEPFVYFVQVGAYTRNEDAEQQRARLGLIGYAARVSEREQSGRTVYRVRLGPYDSRDEADGVQARLAEASVDARLVRVEKQP